MSSPDNNPQRLPKQGQELSGAIPTETRPIMVQPDETPTPPRQPAEELLPVVYAELRRLAAALLSRLPPGQTLTDSPTYMP